MKKKIALSTEKKKNNQSRKASIISAAALSVLLVPFMGQAQVPDTLMAIRTTNGTTRMSLQTTGSFYLGGTYDGGYSEPPVVEGAGTRLLWYPAKGAFRAGGVSSTQWDHAVIGDYSVAMGQDVRASASNATAFGLRSTAAQQSSFAAGEEAVASGAASVALGYHSHTNARQGSFVFGDRSTVDTIRAGVNHSATWRVSGGFRLFTSSNLSTGVTIQSGASVSNWGQSNAVISTSTGAYLSTSGVWTNVSDSNRKQNIQPIGGEEILARLRRLPISTWSYRNDGATRHIGPMAQDFRAVFGLGDSEKAIGTIDADGVALAGVQALEARTRHQAADMERLKAENTSLRNRLDAVEKRTQISNAGFPQLATFLLAGGALGGILLRRRRTAIRKA